jgi:hypothetical protein
MQLEILQLPPLCHIETLQVCGGYAAVVEISGRGQRTVVRDDRVGVYEVDVVDKMCEDADLV